MDPADRDRLVALGVLPAADVDLATDPAAADRVALIDALVEWGATADEIVGACRTGDLPGLCGDLLLNPRGTSTLREIGARLGIPLDELEGAVRAQGLPVPGPDDRVMTEDDERAMGLVVPGLELFPEEVALQLLRVIGSSVTRIAEACVAAYLDSVERVMKEGGRSELDMAISVREAVGTVDSVADALGPMLTRHLHQAIWRSREARRGLTDYGTVRMAVGFVDLVGYTPLARTLSTADLADLVGTFEAAAYDTAAVHDGRVVKLIGDEVMFVALDVEAACQIALALVDHPEIRAAGADPRAGVAAGELLMRDGDYFGPVVNMASRMADLAVPLEVLATTAVHEALGDAASPIVVTPAGRRMLKGFDAPVELVSITPPAG
jgi:class 3 adenylate cyclase